MVRVFRGNEIPLPPFYLNLTSFLPQFYLFLTSFLPFFNLNLTSALSRISNHGLETTVYRLLAKNHDSQRRDRILRIFLRLDIGQFLHTLGCFSYQIAQKTWRNREKSTGENSKNPVETAPRNCRNLFLVVVEGVLIFGHKPKLIWEFRGL